MSEEGNNIVIDFTENEEAIFNPPGELESLTVTGEVNVINSSEEFRLWNIGLSLSGLGTVEGEVSDNMKVGTLNPQAKWTQPYQVKEEEIQTKSLLKITEIIDTYFEKGVEVNWALVKDRRMPISFTISLENTSSNTASHIKLVKQLPEAFGEPIIDPPTQGDINFNDETRTITWEDFQLQPGGVQSLIIRVGFKPETIEPFNTGNIDVHYIVRGLNRSKISGTTTAHTDSMFAIDQGETGEPGEWECTAEFENMSDFIVELKNVTVNQIIEDRKELVLEENPDYEVLPDASWSKDFTVKSSNVPKFSNVNDFLVVPKIVRRVIGHIKYLAGALPVANIECEKIIDPPVVSAYTKTPINISLVVTNAGSAILNEITFRDVIPPDFKPPDLDEVDVYLGEEEIRNGIIREIDPSDPSPESQHTITVKLDDMSSFGGFEPEDQLQVVYPLTAWDPKPKVKYPCPLDVSSNVSPPGPSAKIPTTASEIEIKYVRRRIRAHKGLTPGAEAGEYIIPIVFENKGEVLIENITIKDVVPANYDLLDWDPKDPGPATADIEKGLLLTWKLEKAEPGEKIKFKYTIKGTGEYEREELEVSVG